MSKVEGYKVCWEEYYGMKKKWVPDFQLCEDKQEAEELVSFLSAERSEKTYRKIKGPLALVIKKEGK